MSAETCRWHNPDEQGRYTCARFWNPKTNQGISMFFNGAQITLRLEMDNTEIAHMNHPIYFCPMCGERVRLEAKSDEDVE